MLFYFQVFVFAIDQFLNEHFVRQLVEIRNAIKESVLRDGSVGVERDRTIRIGSSCCSDRRHERVKKNKIKYWYL